MKQKCSSIGNEEKEKLNENKYARALLRRVELKIVERRVRKGLTKRREMKIFVRLKTGHFFLFRVFSFSSFVCFRKFSVSCWERTIF